MGAVMAGVFVIGAASSVYVSSSGSAKQQNEICNNVNDLKKAIQDYTNESTQAFNNCVAIDTKVLSDITDKQLSINQKGAQLLVQQQQFKKIYNSLYIQVLVFLLLIGVLLTLKKLRLLSFNPFKHG
jgi:hypothetical protein